MTDNTITTCDDTRRFLSDSSQLSRTEITNRCRNRIMHVSAAGAGTLHGAALEWRTNNHRFAGAGWSRLHV